MTSVTIVPIADENGETMYQAVCGQLRSSGNSAGEALDAITQKIASDMRGTLVVVQDYQPDALFTEESSQRLRELMVEWRQSRDAELPFDKEKQSELDALIDAELLAATQRSAVIARESDA